MGQTLSGRICLGNRIGVLFYSIVCLLEPVTSKDSEKVENHLYSVGSSCMQGWRISKLTNRLHNNNFFVIDIHV